MLCFDNEGTLATDKRPGGVFLGWVTSKPSKPGFFGGECFVMFCIGFYLWPYYLRGPFRDNV